MTDYTTLSDDDLAALIDEHQAMVDDAEEEQRRRREANIRRIHDESRPYLAEAREALTTLGYRIERNVTTEGPITRYFNACYFPDGVYYNFWYTFGQDDDDALLDVCVNILGNLRIWHEQREATR